MGIPVVRQTSCDGVPVFQVDQPGPTQAGLMFRVGQADETVLTRGITHLVEHLTLSSIDNHLPHNGMVDPTKTLFVVKGTEDEVARFFREVCANLANLPLHRLELESRILRTEAADRKPGPPEQLTSLRYGFQGHGLLVLPEFFLNNPKPDVVRQWAAEWFNRANCVMWIAGKIPADLALPLPEGVRHPMPAALHIPYVRFPAATTMTRDVVGMNYHSPRTSVARTNLSVLAKRLHDQIRMERGLSYLTAQHRESLSNQVAENTIWISSLEEHAGQSADAFLSIVGRLASAGPSDDELAADLTAFLRAYEDPDALASHAGFAAICEIEGIPVESPEELLEERRAVTGQACAEELRLGMTAAIVLSPRFVGGRPGWLHEYPMNVPPVSGRSFRRAGGKPWAKTESLIVGPSGISVVPPGGGNGGTVHWTECVGLVVTADGQRLVLSRDGFRIPVDPRAWSHGAQALQLIDRSVPPQLRIEPAAS